MLLGILSIYLASIFAFGGLIKFSLNRPATRFILLGNVVIPLLALYALFKALLPESWFGEEAAVEVSTDGLEDAEDEVEAMRQEIFGNRRSLWVAKRFEKRYNTYLGKSIRGFDAFGAHVAKKHGSV
ncbi:MAG TPA: hypothetical protein VGJ00_08845 [Rhabdochlamydiaceae bacterium]|jgi:hypothetical protein